MPTRTERRAFTLVELMVVVAVIAVLLGLSLPALRAARVTADTTGCLVNLSSIAKLQAAYSAGNNGIWPNALGPGTGVVYWRFGNIGFAAFGVLVQTDWWPGPLWAAGYYDTNEPTQGLSCPVVFRAWRDAGTGDSDGEDAPIRSYRYSAAMFTEAKFWDPMAAMSEMARVDEIGANRFRKNVRIEEVKFPSHKVVMSERADFHGRGARFGDPGLVDSEKSDSKANASFADGHVERVEPYRAQTPLVVRWGEDWLPSGRGAIPFSASAWGYRGRDY